MLQVSSILWFIPKNYKNNYLFYIGNFLIFSLQYLLLLIVLESRYFLWLFVLLSFLSFVYQFLFYAKQNRRIGLLLLYGMTLWELYLVILFENLILVFLAIIINSIVAASFFFLAFGIMIVLTCFATFWGIIKYIFYEKYSILRE